MSENTLSPFDSDVVHDLEIATSGRSIKIWHGPRNVGFEFACARVTPRHLERLIQGCADRWANETPPDPRQVFEPRAPITALEPYYKKLRQLESPLEAIPLRYPDATGAVVHWFAANNLDSNGKIPVLTLRRARLFGPDPAAQFSISGGSAISSYDGVTITTRFSTFSECVVSPSGIVLR